MKEKTLSSDNTPYVASIKKISPWESRTYQ